MGWTSVFPEVTEISNADVFEMICRARVHHLSQVG